MNGQGPIPEGFEDIAICDRANCSWSELQEMPAHIVENYILLMRAENMKARQNGKYNG